MTKQPLNFKAEANSISGIQKNWTITSYGNTLSCSIPPEFNGPGGGFSPEDLFAQALTNCLLATFKVYAENSKLTFDSINIKTELIVDQNELKKTVMKKCHLNAIIYRPNNKEKAELLIKKSFESGFILNSVKTDLSYTLTLHD